jgi:hypothetical protein
MLRLSSLVNIKKEHKKIEDFDFTTSLLTTGLFTVVKF